MKAIKAIKSTIIIAAITTLTACTADDNNNTAPVNPADAVSITTIVHKADTRASSSYTPEGGTLTLLYGSMSAAADATATYTCDATGAWVTAEPLYWNNLDAISAEYPFYAASPSVPSATPAVPTNQSTPAVYVATDQLIAYAATPERRTAVPLTLHHVLSQITVKLVSATDEEGTPDIPATAIAAATLKIAGAKVAYTMAYSTDAAAPATATTQADAPAATITPRRAVATTTNFHAIVPPQTIAADALKLTFTIDGETYTWSNADAVALEAGINHLISITAKKSTALLGTVDVVPWIETAAIDDQVKLDDITNGASIALPSGTSGSFHLAAIKGNSAGIAVYDWDGTTLVPGLTEPLTWEQLDKGYSYTFRATFNPAGADALGHDKDYLTATITEVPFGSLLNFEELPHANARLSLKLTATDGVLTPAQLTAATATVQINKTSACGTNGIITFTAADDEVVLKPVADAPTARTAILAPQTLSGIALLINGKPYTLAKAIVLESGKHTTVTVDIVGSEVAISVAVAPWTDAAVDGGGVEIDPK